MQVKIKENWVLYDKPRDMCIIRFIFDGIEGVRYTFRFSGDKNDVIAGSLTDFYPITLAEEQAYINERRQRAMRRTRNLK